MKMTTLIATAGISLALCGTVFAQLNPIVFEVYPNMAKVTFEAATDGETLLRLPAGFEPSSVKVVERQGAATVKSFKVESGAGNFTVPDHLSESKKEIDTISKNIDETSAKLSGLELSALILDNLNADKIKQEELTAYITKTAALRSKTELEIKALNKTISEAKEKLKVLQAEYDKRIPTDWNKTVNVTVKTEGKGKVYIEAYTNKAGWMPEYKMNLDSATGKITATLAASVHQATGIKWSGKFVLNTSSPMHGNTSTQLQPLVGRILTPQQPVPYAMKSAAPMDELQTLEITKEMGAIAVYNETAINYSYTANASVSGNGANETLPLKNFTINSNVLYEAIPLLEDKAFITANVAALPEALLQGKAALYIDGEHSQETNLSQHVKGSEFSTAFGLSAGISTSREQLIMKKDSSWRKGYMNDGYDIKVTNGTAKTQKITVKDRIPVSADTKIKVENIEMSPKGAVDTQGICTWALEVKPNETINIKVRYTVAYPSDSEIIIN